MNQSNFPQTFSDKKILRIFYLIHYYIHSHCNSNECMRYSSESLLAMVVESLSVVLPGDAKEILKLRPVAVMIDGSLPAIPHEKAQSKNSRGMKFTRVYKTM
ncbi:hypothetical protein EQH57_0096 [Dictyocoela roeselum]|nr:hypothetical protein EQH57_0096 [Dictyocoela roeselum]